MQDLAALKAELLNYTDDETSAFFQSAINKCCQRINRDVRLSRLPFEITETVQGSAMPNGHHTLPATFAALEDARYAFGDGMVELKFQQRRDFWRQYTRGANIATPTRYTIENDINGLARFVLADEEPGDLAYQLTYTAKPTTLVNDADTNWLLQNHESLYLYGSLIELAPFRDEDYRAQTWAQFYDDAADEFKKLVDAQKFPRADIQRAPSALTVV